MAEIWGGEWRAQTATIKYPFADRALLSNSAVFLPEGAILDAVLHPPGAANAMYLSSVAITSETITLFFGDEANKRRCSGAFVAGQDSDEIRLADAGGFAAGVLVVDPVQFGTLQSWGGGEHLFTRLQTELAPSVCLPTPEIGVRRVSIEGKSLAGEVWLSATTASS